MRRSSPRPSRIEAVQLAVDVRFGRLVGVDQREASRRPIGKGPRGPGAHAATPTTHTCVRPSARGPVAVEPCDAPKRRSAPARSTRWRRALERRRFDRAAADCTDSRCEGRASSAARGAPTFTAAAAMIRSSCAPRDRGAPARLPRAGSAGRTRADLARATMREQLSRHFVEILPIRLVRHHDGRLMYSEPSAR